MVKFVANSSDGFPVKRKQIPRACQACRKRKKRCPHVPVERGGTIVPKQPVDHSQDLAIDGALVPQAFSNSTFSSASPVTPLQPPYPSQPFSSPHLQRGAPWQGVRQNIPSEPISRLTDFPPADDLELQSAARPTNPRIGGDACQAPSEGTEPTSDEESQFIGHTNPQGIFLAAASPTASIASGGGDKIGVWLPRNTYEQIRKHRMQSFSRKSYTLYGQNQLISKVLLPCLLDQSLHLLPNPVDFAALQTIYKREVHPIFPVVEFDMPPPSTAESSPSKTLLMQAICLAAATSLKARPHLKLPSLSDSVQNPKDFISYLSQAVLTFIDLGTSRDKLVAVQALSVLSLFSQLSNDNHSSAEYCGRAVSYAQTLQLHLDTSRFRKDHQIATRLFLCVWALDRLNAAFHGRPVLMHGRDFGRDMTTSISQQNNCFRLFLVVVELLDKIIDLYRPSAGAQSNIVDEFPLFEDLIIQTGSQRIPGYLIATIEILYHAVAMLSCRFNSLDEPDRASSPNIRQNFSASRVISIVGSEFSEDVALIPFVPYAVALCLRVSYRELRVSKVPLLRARSRRQLLRTCALLRRFDTFASAGTMADLAEQTVREMDKVAASMISGRRQTITELCTPGEQEANQTVDPAANEDSSSSRNSARVLDPRTHTNDASTSTPHIENGQGFVTFNNQDNQDLNLFNFDLDFAELPDIDLFEHFDPDFRLPAVDAALGQSVDLSAFADFDFWSATSLIPSGSPSSLPPATI